MEGINRILVVSRSTVECKKAFHYGVSLSRTYGARLYILHVEYDPFTKVGRFFIPSLASFEEEYRARVKEIKAEIDAMISHEKTEGMVIEEMIEDGDPAEQTLRAVEKGKADLIIMAAHEEGRIERIIYGRSTHEIVRKLPCSVLLVKGEQ